MDFLFESLQGFLLILFGIIQFVSFAFWVSFSWPRILIDLKKQKKDK